MKLSKFKIFDEITTSFGIAGTLAIIIGGGSCIIGLSGTGLMKVGEFFSNHKQTLQKMMFYGSVGAGSGLFFVGVAAAAAQLRDEAGDEEMAEIAAAYTAAVQRSEATRVHPQNKERTWAEWQEFEEIKTFCRGCQYYGGGGLCALFGESKSGCSDRNEKQLCTNCKYYSNDELLPCAVHPLGLRRNCPDWESHTED